MLKVLSIYPQLSRTQAGKMSPRGTSHEVRCPEINCGFVCTSIKEATWHYVTLHAGKCPLCSMPCAAMGPKHVEDCTMKVWSICNVCEECYEVQSAHQHYLQHTEVSLVMKWASILPGLCTRIRGSAWKRPWSHRGWGRVTHVSKGCTAQHISKVLEEGLIVSEVEVTQV